MIEDESLQNPPLEEQLVGKIEKQSFWEKLSGRLLIILIIGVIVFLALAVVQHGYVQSQINKLYENELASYAKQVSTQLVVTDKWQLEQYRRAAIQVPQWIIVEDSGLLIDVEGVVPGLYDQVELLDKNIFITPKNITTDTGESWRLFGRKLSDGYLVVGIKTPHSDVETDSRLKTNADKFGMSVAQAQLINSKDVEYEIDYAVVNASKKLVLAWGGVPLRITQSFVDLSKEGFQELFNDQHSYLILVKALTSQSGKHVGKVIVPLDTTKEIQALKYIDRCNYVILFIAALLTTAVLINDFRRKYKNTVKMVSIDEAIKYGESKTVEFKTSYHWDIRFNIHKKELIHDVLRSMAGLMNGNGGQLFIGITEETGKIEAVGIMPDLYVIDRHQDIPLDKRKDVLLLNLRENIINTMGSAVSDLISETIEEYQGKLILVITLKPSAKPVYVKWKPKGQSQTLKPFFVRDGPRTIELDTEGAVEYIRKRWRR